MIARRYGMSRRDGSNTRIALPLTADLLVHNPRLRLQIDRARAVFRPAVRAQATLPKQNGAIPSLATDLLKSRTWLYQAYEAIQTVEEQATQLAWIHNSGNSEILAAFSDGEWIGYAMALGGELRIDRHTALVVVEVVQSMQRKGVATALLQSLELWARQSGIHRLELSVLASNEAAINLYFKLGYEREGVRREARFIGNRLVDEWMMAKLLR